MARKYDRQFGGELGGKPLDRAPLTAFVELVGVGTIADIGCGPGHITRFLAQRHPDVIGLDLSSDMVAVARERAPELTFVVASMLALPAADASCAGIVALYSIIHLTADERTTAYREFGRVIQPGGWLLVAFHVDSSEFAAGDVHHVTTLLGEPVELDGYFLAPTDVVAWLESLGFSLAATVERHPNPEIEYSSRRCYLLGTASVTDDRPVDREPAGADKAKGMLVARRRTLRFRSGAAPGAQEKRGEWVLLPGVTIQALGASPWIFPL